MVDLVVARRLACVVSVSALASCSSPATSPDAGTAGGCPPYVSDAGLSTPSVSFARDVMPIFVESCAIGGASCHGDPSVVASARPLLGSLGGDAGTSIFQRVQSGLVGVRSGEDLSMNLVTAGDPAHSFLMHKMDGDQCTLIPECDRAGSYRPNCGVFMPYQAPSILDVVARDTVRRWIDQGAMND
jgi:hypothetical protein